MHKCSLFSTLSPILAICCLFYDGHSDRYEVIPHCGFDSISLMISDIEHLFMFLLAICMFPFDKYLLRSSAHFVIKWLVFWYWVVWAVYIFWILTPYQSYHYQIFSSHLFDCLFISNWYYTVWTLIQLAFSFSILYCSSYLCLCMWPQSSSCIVLIQLYE